MIGQGTTLACGSSGPPPRKRGGPPGTRRLPKRVAKNHDEMARRMTETACLAGRARLLPSRNRLPITKRVADERIRTSTGLPPLAPEASASANSATSAEVARFSRYTAVGRRQARRGWMAAWLHPAVLRRCWDRTMTLAHRSLTVAARMAKAEFRALSQGLRAIHGFLRLDQSLITTIISAEEE